MIKKLCILLIFLLNGAYLKAQNADQYSSAVPNTLMKQALQMIKVTPGVTPPVASRALGYMGVTVYESVVGGNPGHLPLSSRLFGLNNVTAADNQLVYHWPTVVNNALELVIDSLFYNAPVNEMTILRNLKDSMNTVYQGTLDPNVYQRSEQLGIAIGTDIFNYSKTDGGYQSQANNFPPFTPPVGPEMWIPLPGQAALQPYWSDVRPFLTADTAMVCVPGAFPTFDSISTSTFYQYGNQVYNAVNNLTQGQTDIANFYADGGGTMTPPGHSVNVLRLILETQNHDLAFAAEAYAKVGCALADAFKVCWKTKYIYNLIRPVSYINRYIDANWTTIVATPPFPEYISGHSTQSGAWAETMESLFGQNYSFIDSTNGTNFGGHRTLASFDAWADEAAISRLYGGIHYEFSNNIGVSTGTLIGQNINTFFATLATGIEQPMLDIAEVAVIPNPTTGYVRLIGDLSRATQIDVYNYVGSQVLTLPVNNDLDFSNLSSGIYIVRATGDNFARVARVVVGK